MSFPNEDAVVTGKLKAALGELGHCAEDFDIRDYGTHRLYTTAVMVRDDEDITAAEITRLLNAYNRVGKIKPQVYRVEGYLAGEPNFTWLYVSVYI